MRQARQAARAIRAAEYDVKDLALADEGRRRIEWSDAGMPVLAEIRARFEKEKPLRGQVTLDDPLSRVQDIFDRDNVAVVVEENRIIGVISKIDVVEFLAART